jgi:hypothetical protein
VDVQTVLGTLSLYVLVGVFFGSLYSLADGRSLPPVVFGEGSRKGVIVRAP